MSRVFWMAVGAMGGVAAYRKGTRAVHRARELGPLGTAQVAAATTSRLAGRTAHGLGRLQDLRAQREGRLVIGSAEEVAVADPAVVPPMDDEWVPVPGRRTGVGAGTRATTVPTIAQPRPAPDGAAPRPEARTARTTRARRG
ncbi:MAG: hypothetical protein MUF35_10260 [Candidatus Nanopelagicales bacterium]|jgi:hypothetical protein|nr:hypothetical protein [Candidatus Nanopelagicales bacterium]